MAAIPPHSPSVSVNRTAVLAGKGSLDAVRARRRVKAATGPTAGTLRTYGHPNRYSRTPEYARLMVSSSLFIGILRSERRSLPSCVTTSGW